MKPILSCTTASEQHFWIAVPGKGLQCYSCPSCHQRIYWSEILKKWVNVTGSKKEGRDE